MLPQVTAPKEVCAGCDLPIEDRFLLKVSGKSWHEACLQCDFCGLSLRESCYSRDGRLVCRRDYERFYGSKCSRCHQALLTSDLVMRASGCVFHEACFRCAVCGQRLRSGNQFVLCGPHLVCCPDFERQLDWLHSSQSDGSNCCCGDDLIELDLLTGSKRPRTILTTAQRRKFKAAFEVNPKPSRKVRESLASETGLCVRVVQVWFQNQRAKVKQIARKDKADKNSSNSSNSSIKKDKKDSAKPTYRPQKMKTTQDSRRLYQQVEQSTSDRSLSEDTNSYLSSGGAENYFPDVLTPFNLHSCQDNLFTPQDESNPLYPATPGEFDERMDHLDNAFISGIKGHHMSEVMNSSFYPTESLYSTHSCFD